MKNCGCLQHIKRKGEKKKKQKERKVLLFFCCLKSSTSLFFFCRGQSSLFLLYCSRFDHRHSKVFIRHAAKATTLCFTRGAVARTPVRRRHLLFLRLTTVLKQNSVAPFLEKLQYKKRMSNNNNNKCL